MRAECPICHRFTDLQKHHIIKGRGRRKECTTPDSVIYLCQECHQGTNGVHGKNGHELDLKLRRWLQRTYFRQDKSEAEVRKLMGGKLMLDENGEIYV